MIILKNLKWDNCFSYGENNSLDLDIDTVAQLVGENGAGKSSIPLILQEVLYNKNSKGVKKADIPNRKAGGKYSIELTFDKGVTEYRIVVNRGTSIKVKLFKNDEDISSHTATNTFKQIEEIIGLDFKTFSQLVYQDTSSSLDFLTATDSARKKFLVELFSLDEYTRYFEIFKEALRVEKASLSSTLGKVEGLESWLDSNAKVDTTPQPVPKILISTEKDEEWLRDLRQKLKNILETNSKIDRNNQLVERAAELSKVTSITAIIETPRPTEHLVKQKHTAEAELNTITKELRKLAQLGEVCPGCLQEISEEVKARMETERLDSALQLKTKIDELTTEISSIEKKNTSISQQKEEQHALESTYKSIKKDLPTKFLDEDTLEEEINELKASIDEKNKQIKAAESARDRILEHNAKIAVIEDQIVAATAEIEAATKVVDSLEEKVANLDILRKAFSTSGLVAYKLENLVQDLEQITNEYLGLLSDGRFTISFNTENDKLNVDITDNGAVVNILSLSSGERARVCTAVLLSMRKLMSSIANTKINTLFLDEVISVLDIFGRENLMDILMQENELNTYVVSHGWTGSPLLTKIEVTKTNGISTLDNKKDYGKSTNEGS